VNLDKWKSLAPAARDFLSRQALAYEGARLRGTERVLEVV